MIEGTPRDGWEDLAAVRYGIARSEQTPCGRPPVACPPEGCWSPYCVVGRDEEGEDAARMLYRAITTGAVDDPESPRLRHRDEPCPECGGTGWHPWSTAQVVPVGTKPNPPCPTCHGTGKVKQETEA